MSPYLFSYLLVNCITASSLILDLFSAELDLHLQRKTFLVAQNLPTRWRCVLKTFEVTDGECVSDVTDNNCKKLLDLHYFYLRIGLSGSTVMCSMM